MNDMRISEAAEATGLNASTIRYYEKEGLIPTVNRDNGGIRKFSKENVDWIEFIKCMRGAGLSIDSLQNYTEMLRQGDSTISARKKLLEEERQLLIEKRMEIDETIERLNIKIDNYEEA